METNTFAIEYNSNTPEFTDDVRSKVEKRLHKLARGKRGINRAVVAIQTGDTSPREYRVRIAVYDHSNTATVTEKGTSLSSTVSQSLDAVERQFRETRDKKRDLRRRSGNGNNVE
jgi:ribosome-associated translation inhibitor RaiA